MRWYWSSYSFPELAPFSYDQRIQLVMRCTPKLLRRHWMVQIIYVLVTITGPVLLWFWTKYNLGVLEFLAAFAPFAIMYQLELHRLREIVKTELPGYCDRCGYDLRGNASGICPECGAQIPPKQKELPPHRNRFFLAWYLRGADMVIMTLSALSIVALIVIGFNAVRKFLSIG